jgi:hypothetical protein
MKLLDRLKTRLDTMMTKKERDMQRLLMLIKEQSFHNFIFLRHHRITTVSPTYPTPVGDSIQVIHRYHGLQPCQQILH